MHITTLHHTRWVCFYWETDLPPIGKIDRARNSIRSIPDAILLHQLRTHRNSTPLTKSAWYAYCSAASYSLGWFLLWHSPAPTDEMTGYQLNSGPKGSRTAPSIAHTQG